MKKAKPGFQEDDLEDYFNRMRNFLEDTIQSYPERVKNNYDSYVYFCESVVKELLIEDSLR